MEDAQALREIPEMRAVSTQRYRWNKATTT